jgi:hypothetical protein
MTSQAAIQELAATVHAADHAREALKVQLREAHKAGATVQVLQDWTGYSRRTIFYMLKEKEACSEA